MRCSSCEVLLDEFVDASLPPPRMSAVAAHLQGCPACEKLHRRLRVVDALLETARPAALPADFTFDVMAAVRTLPPPAVARKPLLVLAGLYLAGAWVVVAVALAFLAPGASGAARGIAHLATGFVQAMAQGMHALLPVAPLALPLVVSVLCVDALLFAIVIVFYRTVRPRLTAHLAAVAVERE